MCAIQGWLTGEILSSDPLVIAGREFKSRLFLGTAGYPNRQVMLDALAASGTEMVTAAIRRISLAGDDESLLNLIPKHIQILPNSAGSRLDVCVHAPGRRRAASQCGIRLAGMPAASRHLRQSKSTPSPSSSVRRRPADYDLPRERTIAAAPNMVAIRKPSAM